MNWDDLKFFAELARTGSLSAAARGMKVDHSTVARHVDSLEQALGVRLFDRLPRGWALTADGAAMAERVRPLEEEIYGLSSFARGRSCGLDGTVRLSAPPGFASMYLMPRMGLLRERHPGIEIEVVGEARIANLTRREADLALRLGRPEGASMVVRRMPDFAYALFAHPDYLARVPQDQWSFVGHDESLAHAGPQQWLHRYAAGRPVAVRGNDVAGLLGAVRSGVGVGVLSAHLIELAPDLVCLGEGDPLLARDFWLVVHADVRRSPAVRAVMDVLVEMIEGDRALIEGPVRKSTGDRE